MIIAGGSTEFGYGSGRAALAARFGSSDGLRHPLIVLIPASIGMLSSGWAFVTGGVIALENGGLTTVAGTAAGSIMPRHKTNAAGAS